MYYLSMTKYIHRRFNFMTVNCRDGSAKLWDVGESSCLGNVIEGHGQINCCSIATTTNEVEVENEREVRTYY